MIDLEQIILAKDVTRVTLVGYLHDKFPASRGNCFSVVTEDDKHFRILNFNHENLEELERTNVFEWPLKILPLDSSHAVICDERIPHEWYDEKFCSTCTPRNLLPLPQRLRQLRDIQSGRKTEKVIEIEGKKHIMTTIHVESKIVHVPYIISTSSNIDTHEGPGIKD
jgi:hypothetical protein